MDFENASSRMPTEGKNGKKRKKMAISHFEAGYESTRRIHIYTKNYNWAHI
jgi:hypothetical protein